MRTVTVFPEYPIKKPSLIYLMKVCNRLGILNFNQRWQSKMEEKTGDKI